MTQINIYLKTDAAPWETEITVKVAINNTVCCMTFSFWLGQGFHADVSKWQRSWSNVQRSHRIVYWTLYCTVVKYCVHCTPLVVDVSLLLQPQSGTVCQKQSVLRHLWRCSERHWRRDCSRNLIPTNSITITWITACFSFVLWPKSFWILCHVNVNSLTN